MKPIPIWAMILALALLACVPQSRGDGAPPPEILGLEASATCVESGERVRLKPTYRHGRGILLPGPGEVPSGKDVFVAVDTPTTFTLSVTGPDGRAVTRELALEVEPALLIRTRGLRQAKAWITVTGPWGYREVAQAPCTLRGLQPGTYTLEAGAVEDGGGRKLPWEPVQTVVVDTGVAVTFLYPEPAFEVPLPGCAPLEFLLMPAGTFRMGTDVPEDPGSVPGPLPRPVHEVSFRTAFYMAKHLTTREQWWAVAGEGRGERHPDPTFPVDGVSYRDITETFLPALAPRMPDQAFALPSEAMWEYACRAGTSTRYFSGENGKALDAYAWRRPGTPLAGHPVGGMLPNPWGLHDLFGRGYQGCADIAYPDYVGAPADGSARLRPLRARNLRIARGGDDWGEGGPFAQRYRFNENLRSSRLGLRLVATLPWFGPGNE